MKNKNREELDILSRKAKQVLFVLFIVIVIFLSLTKL